jgi:hypothetical protein
MKPKILLAVLILASQCFAWDRQHQGQNQHQTQTVNSNNTVTNSHNNTANGGNATGGSASSGGNTVTSVSNQVSQVPPAFAPDAFPSAPCRVAASAGGSSQWFGMSIGGSKLDKDCAKRELARLLLAAGQRQAAVDALCSTQAARGIENCNALEMAPIPEPVPVIESEPALPVIVASAPVITINVPAMPVLACHKPIHKNRASKPCLEK